jgi:peptidoglycan/LPS O-acetylase OafA/YrhL
VGSGDALPLQDAGLTRPARGHHQVALDGLRGVAILLVMLFHAQVPFAKECAGPLCAADRAALALCRSGWCGVDLFFVLSGFLITGILLDARPERGAGTVTRYFSSFYARRTLRIFPLHYALLALFFLVVPALPHAGSGVIAREIGEYAQIAPDQWWFWAYLGNIYFASHGFAGHGIPDVLWSLAIEEQFYVAWPVAVLLLPRRALAWTCAALATLAIAFRLAMAARGMDPTAVFLLTPGRIDGLAIGALVAIVARSQAADVVLARSGIAMVVIGALPLAWSAATAGPLDEYSGHMQSFGFTALALVGGGVVAFVVADPGSAAARLLSMAPLRILGKYAFALYLFHLSIQPVLRSVLFRAEAVPTLWGSHLPGLLAFDFMLVTTSLGAAWLSWNLFERHFLRLKDRFPMPTRCVA